MPTSSRLRDDRLVRLARLCRTATGHGASRQTREVVHAELMAALGSQFRVAAAVESKAAPVPAVTAKTITNSAPAATSIEEPISQTNLDATVRRLVEIGAPWERLRGPAWEQFRLTPTAEMASSLVELAFLHGDPIGVAQIITQLKVYGKAFWSLVHPAVRAHVVADLWQAGQKDVVVDLLFRDRDMAWLHPVERLLVVLVQFAGEDVAKPWIYYRQWRKDIEDAAIEVGASFGVTRETLWLAVGRAGIDLGYDDEAREILKLIGPTAPEYDFALKNLFSVSEDSQGERRNEYFDLVMAQADWRERLRLIRNFFATTRELGGFRDRSRPAFNDLLSAPLELLPRNAEAWAELSRALVSSSDIENLLPNLLRVFRDNAMQFHGPTLDPALWQGMLTRDPESPDYLVRYWYGVGQLHNFTSFGHSSEAALWQARSMVLGATRAGPVPFTWRELHLAATAHVARAAHLFDKDRATMLRQLRIACAQEQVVVADIEEYLRATETPPLFVMESLRVVVRERKARDLEIRLVLKSAETTHLRNQDLGTLWQLASERVDSDLAWRVASIALARGALVPNVRHAWDISGEKRSHYPFQKMTLEDLRPCFDGMTPVAQRMVMACLQIGNALPELLAILDGGARSSKIVAPANGSVEAEVETALRGLDWLKPVTKRWHFSFDTTALGGTTLPAFMHVLPTNLWSLLVLKICERLGIHSWGWKVSMLHGLIADLIPRVAKRQDLRRHSFKVAAWLRKLGGAERAAWQDLAYTAKGLKDDEALDALATFVTRFATVMLPNHHMALTSLQAMRAPVSIIWSLENWIVSPDYSRLRDRLGTKSRVPVPNSLARLPTIIK